MKTIKVTLELTEENIITIAPQFSGTINIPGIEPERKKLAKQNFDALYKSASPETKKSLDKINKLQKETFGGK